MTFLKAIIITLLLLLITGCESFEEIVSRETDTDACFMVYNKDPLIGSLRSKEWRIMFFQVYEEEMIARNLDCSERFPNAGYVRPTRLEILLQEE